MRARLFGWKDAQYANYTCYSGLTDFVPPYNSTIGYVYAYEIRTILGKIVSCIVSTLNNEVYYMTDYR